MISWIQSHFGDIFVLLILAVIVGGILVSQIKTRKKGKQPTCGSCKGCAHASSCPSHTQ